VSVERPRADHDHDVSHRLAATLAAVWAERTNDASSLARFAATGEISEALIVRLGRDLELLEAAVAETGFAPDAEEWSAQTVVRLLLAYVTGHGLRRPYGAWERLRDDRHLALLFRTPHRHEERTRPWTPTRPRLPAQQPRG